MHTITGVACNIGEQRKAPTAFLQHNYSSVAPESASPQSPDRSPQHNPGAEWGRVPHPRLCPLHTRVRHAPPKPARLAPLLQDSESAPESSEVRKASFSSEPPPRKCSFSLLDPRPRKSSYSSDAVPRKSSLSVPSSSAPPLQPPAAPEPGEGAVTPVRTQQPTSGHYARRALRPPPPPSPAPVFPGPGLLDRPRAITRRWSAGDVLAKAPGGLPPAPAARRRATVHITGRLDRPAPPLSPPEKLSPKRLHALSGPLPPDTATAPRAKSVKFGATFVRAISGAELRVDTDTSDGEGV